MGEGSVAAARGAARGLRVLGTAAGVAVLGGCGVLWGLDGLTGKTCPDGVCDGGDEPVASGDGPSPPPEASLSDDAPDVLDPAPDSGPAGGGDADAIDAPAEACTTPVPPTLDDCKGLVAMPAAPVIDGVLHCGVPLWDMPEVDWDGTGGVPSTVKTQLGAAWRADGLYLFVHVTGAGKQRYPAPAGDGQWCGDAVELFVDSRGFYPHAPAYNGPGTMQFIVEAPSDSMTTAQIGEQFHATNDLGPWTGQFVTVRTGDGFDAEAFVQASDLGLGSWTLATGARVGLDVAVDLGNPAGTPAGCPALGQFVMRYVPTDAACGKPACDVDDFCNPQLQ